MEFLANDTKTFLRPLSLNVILSSLLNVFSGFLIPNLKQQVSSLDASENIRLLQTESQCTNSKSTFIPH